MVIGWVTEDDTATSTVLYWPENNSLQNLTETGIQYHYYLVIPPYDSPAIHCKL